MSELISQKKTTEKNNYSLTANMFLAFIITFAAGTLSFESFMPEKFIAVYSTAVTILCFAIWIVLSVISGKNKKWMFAVYSVLFWSLPQLVIFLANDGPEVFRKSITMYLLSELAAIISVPPLEAAAGFISVGRISFTVIMVLVCVFSYLGGFLVSENVNENIEYD